MHGNTTTDASETSHLSRVVREWENPALMSTQYYHARIANMVEDYGYADSEVSNQTLAQILDNCQLSLTISYAEMEDVDGLFDDPIMNDQIVDIVIRTAESRRRILKEYPKTVGSDHFNIALYALMSRRRKRDRTKHIVDEPRLDHPTRSPTPVVIHRAKPLQYPFSPDDITLLDVNDIIDGHITFDFYEKYLFKSIVSKGRDRSLLSFELQQLMTRKMLMHRQHPLLLAWEFPLIVQITKIELGEFLKIPFVSVEFFGHPDTETAYFAHCDVVINGQVHEDVTLEMALLVQTPCYHLMAIDSFKTIVSEPRLSVAHEPDC